MTTTTIKSVFDQLSKVKFDEKEIKTKGDFTYVPWAVAQRDVFSLFPETKVTWGDIRFLKDGTCLVKTTVEIAGVAKEQELPVQNYRCQSLQNPDCNDVNKAFQRCFVKNLSQFGYGLKFFLGEDPFDYSKEGAEPDGQVQSKDQKTSFPPNKGKPISDDDEILQGDILELASEADLHGMEKEKLINAINHYCKKFKEETFKTFDEFETAYKKGHVSGNVSTLIRQSLQKFLKKHITQH
jgi:hypothetical protein